MSFKQLSGLATLLGISLIVPVCLLTPQNPHALHEAPALLALFALYAFTEFFKLQRHHMSISLSLSVDLLLLLKFGLPALVIVSQTLIFLARWRRVGKVELWPTLANGGMLLVQHSVATLLFLAAGGTFYTPLVDNVWPLFAYFTFHILANHTVLFLLVRSLNEETTLRTYLPSMRFDVFSSVFAASLGMVLTLLYEVDGVTGVLAFGAPMILCVYVFKLFNDVSRSSTLFRNLANLTSTFSGELDEATMSRSVTTELPKWFDRTQCLIYLHEEDGPRLLSQSQNCPVGTAEALTSYLRRIAQELASQAMVTKRLNHVPEFAHSPIRSLLVASLVVDHREIGYLCLTSSRLAEFDATVADTVSVLANQLSVSFRMAKRYEDVEKQSLYDALTGLPNHRYCERRLQEVLVESPTAEPVSLLLLDLDHFKQINDRYGHEAGNIVLQQTAHAFATTVRAGDFVARYGGEEFVVVLPGTDALAAFETAEKIRQRVEQLRVQVTTMDGTLADVQLTVSIGVASCPLDAKDPQQLFRFADRAMYMGAKRAGRNRVALYRHETDGQQKDLSLTTT